MQIAVPEVGYALEKGLAETAGYKVAVEDVDDTFVLLVPSVKLEYILWLA